MFTEIGECHFAKEFVHAVFGIEGKHFLAKEISANVSLRCGEKCFRA